MYVRIVKQLIVESAASVGTKKKFGGPERLKKCCIQGQCKFVTFSNFSNTDNEEKLKPHTSKALESIENEIKNLSK